MRFAVVLLLFSNTVFAQYSGPAVDTCLAYAKREAVRDGTGANIVFERDQDLMIERYTRKLGNQFVSSILRGNGAWEPTVLVAGIEQERYDAVILNRPIESIDDREWTTLWIAPARPALTAHYRLAETATIDQQWTFLEPTRYVYVPRRAFRRP